MIMEDQKLIEKHAKAAGVDVKVGLVQVRRRRRDERRAAVGQPAVRLGRRRAVRDAVGEDARQSRRQGGLGDQLDAAVPRHPQPEVKTIKDFTDKDKIALPAVKVSIQAVTLQMAAEKAFGDGQQNKLDHLTVSMAHPDAETALLSGRSEITAHFGSPPFQYQELEQQGMHKVLSSYDVLGGPATFNVVWTTTKFHDENPKVYAAFVAALDEATATINRDKRAAAQTYLRISKDKDSLDDILEMLNDPEIEYTTTPKNVMKYVDFMYKIGSIKVKPDSWKDMFFPQRART